MSDRRYPLSWPAGWPRARWRQTAAFGKMRREKGKSYDTKSKASIAESIQRLQGELDRLGASSVVLSTNIELRMDGAPRSNVIAPTDPGAAIYFKLNDRDIALACDKWDRTADNIIALAKHIEAMRGMDRWGVGKLEQAFRGYEALPAPEQWWQVLDVRPNATESEIKEAYRRKAGEAHPDKPGGSDAAMARLNSARDRALAEIA